MRKIRVRARKLAYVAVVNVYVIADAQLSEATATSRRRREPSSAPAKVRVCRSRRIQWCISTAGAAVISLPLASPLRSLPLFRSGLSSLSLFLSLALVLSFPSLRAAYSRRQAKACTFSTYSVRCADALSAPRAYISVYKAARAIRPHTPNHATHGHPPTPTPTSPFADSRPPLFLPYARKTRPPDTTSYH